MEMKAILIDSRAKTVTQVETDGSLESIYKLIGCDLVEVVGNAHLVGEDIIYVDEEGLLKNYFDADGNEIDAPTFDVRGANHQSFVGNGLIVGTSEDGDTISAETSLTEAQQAVSFY
jgi:hypothetical protein